MSAEPAANLGLDGLADLIGLQVRLAQIQFFEAFFEEFADSGITPAEYSILALLAAHPGLRQGVLAEALRIKRSNMTKVMRGLEMRGLVQRTAPEHDGRVFEVRLTGKGRALLREMDTRMLAHDRESAARLSADEQRHLLALLKKLNGFDTRSDPSDSKAEDTING